jgi:alpha-galactosidase
MFTRRDFLLMGLTPAALPAGLKIERKWQGPFCQSKLINTGKQAVRVKEIPLFRYTHTLQPSTPLYGEGFQMLSQTGGTVGLPIDLTRYTDLKHYKIPQPEGAHAFYGMMRLGDETLAFTSCRRFIGKFYVRPGSVEIVLDTENLSIAPGERWELEEFFQRKGNDGLTMLGNRIAKNHPPLKFAQPPTGWCSWYCFGPRVTSKQVLENLDFISKEIPSLKYIQIDDGYQPAMGDWLETGKAFGGDVQGVLKAIRAKGFEPAIWVAPFIAQKDSHLFQQHPDWFIKDDAGQPLPSNQVTFGGWRFGPWYALDGTIPAVQQHFENLFRTMRREWGCTYFKLDANFWGAMHGGHFQDPKATRIEAYRRGMAALLKGAGDAFILGCNHPIWPSFGLIHGSRSSGDISRRWQTFSGVARENLYRNWQNGKLWWNDPDCVLLTGNLPENEFYFHAAAIFATGGMVLSGDDLTKIPPDRLAMLRKLLPPTGVPAVFEDASLKVGVVNLKSNRTYCVFNWGDAPQSVTLQAKGKLKDFWTGAEASGELKDMPPHSARLLVG